MKFLTKKIIVQTTYCLFVITAIPHQSIKFDLLYQRITKPIISYKPGTKWFPKKIYNGESVGETLNPELSVHIDILHDPSPNPIVADVIFIHGLHGSLYNTWKQGVWSYRKQVQNHPLKHKYKLKINSDPKKDKHCPDKRNKFEKRRKSFYKQNHCDNEYDQLLENITDLLNGIDDTLKVADREIDDKIEPYSPCWPKDWIPKDCPGVRVIAVNYTTDPFLWRPVWVAKRNRFANGYFFINHSF